MSIIRTLMRTTVATTLLNEARKPKNQEKAKQLFAQAKRKISGSKAAPEDRTGTTR